MKKSILSLSAVVALGGLGFAGSASAIVVFDSTLTAVSGQPAQAVILDQHIAGTGHMLYVPYFTAQNGEATIINIVNTDQTNGKAVKVRFRGASNSDDLLDFTLFLSPGDVWSGQIQQDPVTGYAQITTPDKSCTIPDASQWPGEFNAARLPSDLSDSQLQALTREGYVEILNMADVVPTGESGAPANTDVYLATKHVNGVPPCSTLDTGDLTNAVMYSAADALSTFGLSNPTGGLMGSWNIVNLNNNTSFSGADNAVIATPDTLINNTLTVTTGAANMIFSPQAGVGINEAVVASTNLGGMAATAPAASDVMTADPLLKVGTTTGTIAPLWWDLPDMSSPLLPNQAAYLNMLTGVPSGSLLSDNQADALSAALAKGDLLNEYVVTAAGASVPMNTDWVVSQPTRRYHATVDYGTSKIVLNTLTQFYQNGESVSSANGYGPQACANFSFGSYNREEGQVASSGGFSPGVTYPYCGEVFTLQFGGSSVLGAAITTRSVAGNLAGTAGWAWIVPASGTFATGIPLTGYAATQFSGNGQNYGQTLPHRWIQTTPAS